MDYQWITNREMPKGISEYEGYIPKRYYHEYKPYLLNESILNSDFENARKKHCNLFIGIGIRVDERRKIITYVNENSPAKRAGIRRGDKIEYIDGKSTFKMDNLLVQLRGSGELGSKIELHISKQSRYKPTSFILNRELIFN